MTIQPIRNEEAQANRNSVETAAKVSAVQKRFRRAVLSNAGMFVGIFLVFVVVVVFTTDIKINSLLSWAVYGASFAILLFCSYSMYVNYYQSGLRAGRSTSQYADAFDKYETLKQQIINRKTQGRLIEFCRYFIKEELDTLRNVVLTEVGLSLEVYNKKYVGKDKEELKGEDLTKAQKRAILRANKIKPIHLSPEMILRHGHYGHARNPLGTSPEAKMGFNFGSKFLQTLFISGITGFIVLEMISAPTWATFASCMIRLMPVLLNGFAGYRMGYENITIDAVNYVSDQSSLIEQFTQYVDTHPLGHSAAEVGEEWAELSVG